MDDNGMSIYSVGVVGAKDVIDAVIFPEVMGMSD